MIHLVHNAVVLRDATSQQRIGDLLARHMAAANMLGRLQVLRDVKLKTGKTVEISTVSRLPRDAQFAETEIDLLTSVKLPANDAAKHVQGLTPVTRHTFDGLTAQYRRQAFTIAGAADQRLIQNIRDKLAETIQSGGTSDDFRAEVHKLTSEAGVQELSSFTLDTAFNTVAQRAYSLGRYEQMTEPSVTEVLPFWQYWTVGDDRVRKEHRVLHMFTARAQDPVWRKIYPPNGFNCRCSVVPILAEEAPKDASDPGLERLPLLARLKVPQPGFDKVFAA